MVGTPRRAIEERTRCRTTHSRYKYVRGNQHWYEAEAREWTTTCSNPNAHVATGANLLMGAGQQCRICADVQEACTPASAVTLTYSMFSRLKSTAAGGVMKLSLVMTCGTEQVATLNS